jgi:hypothetical protein
MNLQNRDFLYIWLGLMVFVTVLSLVLRKQRRAKVPDTEDFIVAGFALGGAIALFKVLVKVISDERLQADLDWDGTVAICISSFLGIYLSLKEVWKLF